MWTNLSSEQTKAGQQQEEQHRVCSGLGSMQLCDDGLGKNKGHRPPEPSCGRKRGLLEVEVHARYPEQRPQQQHEQEANDKHGDVHQRQMPEG